MLGKVNISMIAEERIQAIESTLESIMETLKSSAKNEIKDKWIESKKVREILGVSQKTWQTYRDKKLIPFSQIGHKIYVLEEDLFEFMNKYRIPSRNK